MNAAAITAISSSSGLSASATIDIKSQLVMVRGRRIAAGCMTFPPDSAAMPRRRYRADDASVDAVLRANTDGRQDPRHRARRQHHVHERAAVEPVLGCAFDRGGDALEGNLEVFDTLHRQGCSQPCPGIDQRLEMRA